MLLFFCHFSLGNQPATRKKPIVGYATNRFVDAVGRCFSYLPLLNYNHESLFEIRST
jgi:hypothetical protein